MRAGRRGVRSDGSDGGVIAALVAVGTAIVGSCRFFVGEKP